MSSAIAASTRFHGSVWPPGTHGMLPSGCCTVAIASTVSVISSRVRMPATSGRVRSAKAALPPSPRRRCDLLAVEDDALAEHRVERAFGDRSPARIVLDEMAEEVVVATDGSRVRIVEPVRALEPPVGRVECVRVVRAAQQAPRAFDLQLELVLPVDAHVCARRVV